MLLLSIVHQTVSVGRRRFSANFQLVFRLIKFLIFVTFVSILITLIALPHMTAQDIIVCLLAFMPTGWGLLLVSEVFWEKHFPFLLCCVLFQHISLLMTEILFALQIAQACRPVMRKFGLWGSVRALARGYEIMMGLLLFTPIAFFAWFPFVSEFQTRMLFNQAFSRGLQISRILGGQKKDRSSRNSKDWDLSLDVVFLLLLACFSFVLLMYSDIVMIFM